jgi:hypothetical protein
MCTTEDNCLPVGLFQLAARYQLSMLVQYLADIIIILSNVICSRHDISKKKIFGVELKQQLFTNSLTSKLTYLLDTQGSEVVTACSKIQSATVYIPHLKLICHVLMFIHKKKSCTQRNLNRNYMCIYSFN